MNKVNLLYWKCSLGYGNFGDELSKFIVENMIGNEYELVCNNNAEYYPHHNLVAVGSYIHGSPSNGNVWGSGLISDKSRFKPSINVHSVRGPNTRRVLLDKGINCPEVYGDPALLLSKFYTPNIFSFLGNKIAVLPHWSQLDKFKNLDDKYHFINPTWSWQQVIDELCSCKAVLSSSLHGLICADSYGIPNARLTQIPLGTSHGGNFKFNDYFESQGRPIVEVNNIDEWDTNVLWTGGNNVDLEKLMNSFPFL